MCRLLQGDGQCCISLGAGASQYGGIDLLNMDSLSNPGPVSEAPQQELLRSSAHELGLTQQELAARMAVPWTTFKKWLTPADSKNAREMPAMAVQLLRELKENRNLKEELLKLKALQ